MQTFFKLIRLLIVAPILPVIYAYCRAFRIKYYEIISERYGNHIMDGTNKILFHHETPLPEKVKFFQFHGPANSHWQKMLERRLGRIRNFGPIAPILRRMPFWHDVFILSRPRGLLDIYGKYQNTDVGHPRFTESEEKRCKRWLEDRNVSPDSQIICLMVRDSKYLKNRKEFLNRSMDYHGYRDTDIDDYQSAVSDLTKRGYVVFRMGSNMKKRLEIDNPNFIDYAFDEERSELLDIWLFSKAVGVIGTGTGPDILANVCRKPIMYVNYLPLITLHSFHNTITFPKHLFWKKTGQRLTLNEHLTNGFMREEEYKRAGIIIKDLSTEDLLCATREFINRLEGREKLTSNARHQQQIFWDTIRKHSYFNEIRPWKHEQAKVSERWLQIQDNNFFDSRTQDS